MCEKVLKTLSHHTNASSNRTERPSLHSTNGYNQGMNYNKC